MNAYGTEMDSSRRNPPNPPNGLSSGTENPLPTTEPKKKKQWVTVTTENSYIIPFAAVEIILLIALIAMNYLFRFDAQSRDASSLFNALNVTLSLAEVMPVRQYFDYQLSIADNVRRYGGSIGISFTMEEYAFFVPVFIFPALLFLLVELINFFARKLTQKTVDSIGLRFQQGIRRFFRFYFTFLMFACIGGMVTIFIKLLVPIPRPHFLNVCTGGDLTTLPGTGDVFSTYRVGEMCVATESAVYEALRSFPSYHATIAIYSTTFLCFYLFYSLRLKGVYSLSGLLSLPVVVMGLIGALHRWATYHNTFFDIAWGSLIGIVTALVAVYGMLNRFKERIWLKQQRAEDSQPNAALEGRTNEGYRPPTPLTKTEMVLAKPAPAPSNFDKKNSFAGDSYYGSSSPQPPPLPPAHRMTQPTMSHNGRPTQAFNTNVGPDEDPRRRAQPNYAPSADYNRPRQRFSIPPPPRAPSAPRPRSAHPLNGYPKTNYEGTAYF